MTCMIAACQYNRYKPHMALTHDKLLQMRVSEDFLRLVDDWRRQQPDIPSRSEAIRRLVEIAIATAPKS